MKTVQTTLALGFFGMAIYTGFTESKPEDVRLLYLVIGLLFAQNSRDYEG